MPGFRYAVIVINKPTYMYVNQMHIQSIMGPHEPPLEMAFSIFLTQVFCVSCTTFVWIQVVKNAFVFICT